MRVITGTARGRVLKTLSGDATRPTTGKVKEAIFSSIQFELEGRRVLDLFAGSGGMGIEALSRGASHAVFVDASSAAASVAIFARLPSLTRGGDSWKKRHSAVQPWAAATDFEILTICSLTDSL